MAYSADMLRRVLPVGLVLVSLLGCGWTSQPREGAQVPGSEPGAPTLAPNFSLANDDGNFVSLDELLTAGRPIVVVFYRGHW